MSTHSWMRSLRRTLVATDDDPRSRCEFLL
jgi:hypothetical protein